LSEAGGGYVGELQRGVDGARWVSTLWRYPGPAAPPRCRGRATVQGRLRLSVWCLATRYAASLAAVMLIIEFTSTLAEYPQDLDGKTA